MSAALDSAAGASPLSPEQRALLVGWEGNESWLRTAQVVRIGIDRGVAPRRLLAAVQNVLRDFPILGARVGEAAGYRGLRIHIPVAGVALDELAVLEAEQVDGFSRRPLHPENGECVRFGVVTREGGEQYLLVAASPLVADRGSLAVLANRIQRVGAGETPEPVAFDYPQYLEWRRELEDGEEAAAGKAYWHRYLQAAACAPPRLLYRDSGTRNPSLPRRQVVSHIDGPMRARVSDIAGLLAVTPELLLQALWWALLARLTGCNRYAAGWLHDCRRDYDVMRGAVGAFEKVLPLAIDVDGDESLSAWSKRLADRMDGHREAQEYCPIDEASMAPFLAVGFACADTSGAATVELPGPLPCFELALAADFAADGLALTVFADATLYGHRAIEVVMAQYRLLLQGALEQPDGRLADIALVDDAEWRMVQADLSGPRLDIGDIDIAGVVAHWAATTPGATAIACGEQSLSYAELDTRANRLAHWLRAQGVAAGELVALALPRSPALIVAILAAWRIGAGYLPLEPEWPRARGDAVLADAKPTLLLCDAACEQTSDCGVRAFVLENIALADFAASPPAYGATPDDPAYVLYTSGSTGRPKGVRIGQRQLLNYVVAASAAMDLAGCRRWGLVSSVAADLGNTALFGALFHGACLAIARANEAKDSRAFARFMARHRIDALKIVPSHLDALLEGAPGGEAPPLPRTLVLGGEAATRALVERLYALDANCRVFNHYGPTETTVGVMVHGVAPGTVPEVLPLSRVLANNHVYVLDETLRPAPVGALGELYVGGAQVSAGYLNRDDGGAFIDDPWLRGQRLYRTGDLAWLLPEGGLRLAGRADHQLKIHGYRVEPAEVEAALLALPGIRQAAVFARGASPDGTTLAAVVVGGAELLTDGAWRALLAQRLPSHMLPAALTVLDDFPRLANGKIDRLALAALPPAPAAESAGALSVDALERLLADTMAALLGRERIGGDADFFELGGHSLLVIRLVARIRRLLSLEIEPGLVFDHPTAQDLAAALRAIDDPARLDQLAQQHLAPARSAV